MARWLVSFAPAALKRLVICNRIIQSDVQKRSIDPSLLFPDKPLSRHRSFSSGMQELRSPLGPFAKQQHTGPGLYLSTENRISISRPSALASLPHSFFFRVGVSLRALFIRAHENVQDFPRILPEIPGESVSTERSSEYRDRKGWGKRDGRRRIIAGLSESRNQRAVLAIFCDCYYPTGHFIALKSTYRATAILLPRSLNRTESSLNEEWREREK